MSKILYILLALLLLGFITLVHELGHFIVGKLCGIKVLEFSIGFGPKLLSRTRKDTQYSLRLLPLGGFCRFEGDDDSEGGADSMFNQPVWKRMLTILAGSFMNFLLAFVSCAILLCAFIPADQQPRIVQVDVNTAAASSGIQTGDIISAVNGTPISYDGAGVDALRSIIAKSDVEQGVVLTLQRGEEELEISLMPDRSVDAQTGSVSYSFGIALGARTHSLGEGLGTSARYMFDMTREMVLFLKDLIFHGTGASDLMGPVGIISFASEQIATGAFYAVLNLLLIISLNLFIMNLLPIPGLDGARFVFLIIEAIRRKPIPPEKEGTVHAIGLLLLLLLIVFITYKDIARLFIG